MKILLLDIETAPHRAYVWGLWNQNIAINQIEEPGYTLSWAAKWLGEKEISFKSIHTHKKLSMLSHIYSRIDDADVVIHFNGTKFDLPILNQEFLSMGWSPPSPVLEIDLLKVVRRRFRLPSNKLNYVTQFLGLGKKTPHKGMELWKDCMAGKVSAWAMMEKYNKQDITLLEKLYHRLLPWIPNHPNRGLFSEGEAPQCPTCGSESLQKRGFAYTATLTYQRYRCNSCGAWSKERYTNMDKDKRKNVMKGIV